MRNLVLTSCVVRPIDSVLADADCACVESDGGRVCLWVVARGNLYRVDLENNQEPESDIVKLVDNGHMTSDDRGVGVESVMEMDMVCMSTCFGDILTCNAQTLEVECVGSVEDGILCMSWSPDQEVVVLVTGAHKLLLMTREFDPITETPLYPQEFGEAQPVTVGWGKKETQFHGSLGKSAAQQQQEKNLTPAVSWDDRLQRISWRANGEAFVCSAIDPSTGARKLRVWSRDCVLLSTSEYVSGLEQALHWRPSGSLIACTQRRSQRYDVIFFETNGLRHGEFCVQKDASDNMQIKECQWNNDSSLLALWVEREAVSYLQVWSTGNYHWYLKQELCVPGSLHTIQWDPISPHLLHIFTAAGGYFSYQWKLAVASSLSCSPDNMASVAVIDGAKILLTPFRYMVVPPPMAAHELLLPSPALMVSFAPSSRCSDFAVLLSDGSIAMFAYEKTSDDIPRHIVAPKLVGTASASVVGASDEFCLHHFRHLLWWEESVLLGVTCLSPDHDDYIVELTIDLGSDSVTIREKSRTQCDGRVLCLYGNPRTGSVVVELVTGRLVRYSADGTLSPWLDYRGAVVSFETHPCDQLAIVNWMDKEVVVGLSSTLHTLFIDNTKISSRCTSFGIHNEYLLYTTHQHTCVCVSFDTDLEALRDRVDKEEEIAEQGVRMVERGSRIVTAVPHDVKVVMQLPRGNLETICPRSLVLSDIRQSLNRLDYLSAFLQMRKNRVNMNLLCDHNMASFLTNTSLLVEQLRDVTYINLFLTELREEDVTVTMYPTAAVSRSGNESVSSQNRYQSSGASKVNTVCDAVITTLTEQGENQYLPSIITAHIKKSPSELNTVLRKIKHLKDNPLGNGCVTAEAALKSALVLVDVNNLFNAALGTYDFNLVLMVAEKSQKDPKEYLPFLNELRKLSQYYRQYRIDVHLHRYEQALKNISHCGADVFPECLALINTHRLYKQALQIFTDPQSNQYREISCAYGDHLTGLAQHREAAIVYQRCGELSAAMSCWEKAGHWESVMSLSAQLGHAQDELRKTAHRMAKQLCNQNRHESAARLLLDYTSEVDEAISILLEGRVWSEAVRIAHVHHRPEMIDSHIKPALLEAQSGDLALMESLSTNFLHHVSRLLVVREEKQRKQMAIMEGTFAADEKDADLFSDTSSMTGSAMTSTNASIGTRTSGRTAKTRRKAERKKFSLREGSRNEDLALMDAITTISKTVDKMQDDVGNLLVVLSQFGFTGEAMELQSSFSQLLTAVHSKLATVWPPCSAGTPTPHVLIGPQFTTNQIVQAAATAAGAQSQQPSLPPPPAIRDNVQWKLNIL